jgi:hypothetical protein
MQRPDFFGHSVTFMCRGAFWRTEAPSLPGKRGGDDKTDPLRDDKQQADKKQEHSSDRAGLLFIPNLRGVRGAPDSGRFIWSLNRGEEILGLADYGERG